MGRITARGLSSLVSIALLLAAGPAAALGGSGLITITFDNGVFDPNPPPGNEPTPSIFEEGALYEGFWFVNAGTPGGSSTLAHTHILWSDSAQSLIDVPHSWRNDMMGARISMLDGSSFRVVSIDYRILERLPSDGTDPNSQFARLPWSTPWQEVQLLLSDDPNPATPDFPSFEAQWDAFDIDDGSQFALPGGGFEPRWVAAGTPIRTLQVTGFDDVTEIYLGHTGAYVLFDNIVLEVLGGGGNGTIPEPGTGLLLGAGLGLLALRRRSLR